MFGWTFMNGILIPLDIRFSYFVFGWRFWGMGLHTQRYQVSPFEWNLIPPILGGFQVPFTTFVKLKNFVLQNNFFWKPFFLKFFWNFFEIFFEIFFENIFSQNILMKIFFKNNFFANFFSQNILFSKNIFFQKNFQKEFAK